jgi:hypothetical protein
MDIFGLGLRIGWLNKRRSSWWLTNNAYIAIYACRLQIFRAFWASWVMAIGVLAPPPHHQTDPMEAGYPNLPRVFGRSTVYAFPHYAMISNVQFIHVRIQSRSDDNWAAYVNFRKLTTKREVLVNEAIFLCVCAAHIPFDFFEPKYFRRSATDFTHCNHCFLALRERRSEFRRAKKGLQRFSNGLKRLTDPKPIWKHQSGWRTLKRFQLSYLYYGK